MKFEGIYTPIITPHTEDKAIDKVGFAAMIEYLIESGVHCIVVGGSTGEYYAQSNEERIDMMNFANEIINKRLPMMIGVGATRTEEAILFAKAAKNAGADAILLNSPPYAVPTEIENAMHALQVDKAVNLPIMLYNYPGRTGSNMGAEYLKRVGSSKNFCGIKESSGDINQLHMLANDYPQIGVCCGMDDQALEYFVWGAKCWVCAGSNFLPKEHLALYQACVVENDFIKGRKIMSALLPLMRVLEQGGKFVQNVKYGVELTGIKTGPPRDPLRPLNNNEKLQLEQVVNTLKTTISTILMED